MEAKKIATLIPLEAEEQNIIGRRCISSEHNLCICRDFMMLLDENGSVIVKGSDEFTEEVRKDWQDVIRICSGSNHVLGLKFNGRVAAFGDNSAGQRDVSSWENIESIYACGNCSVGITDDGEIMVAGSSFSESGASGNASEKIEMISSELSELETKMKEMDDTLRFDTLDGLARCFQYLDSVSAAVKSLEEENRQIKDRLTELSGKSFPENKGSAEKPADDKNDKTASGKHGKDSGKEAPKTGVSGITLDNIGPAGGFNRGTAAVGAGVGGVSSINGAGRGTGNSSGFVQYQNTANVQNRWMGGSNQNHVNTGNNNWNMKQWANGRSGGNQVINQGMPHNTNQSFNQASGNPTGNAGGNNDFAYIENGNTLRIVRYNGGSSFVTVPAKLDGKPVGMIGVRAFYPMNFITKVKVEEGVSLIDTRAFENCKGLRNVELPKKMNGIGPWAFSGCSSLEYIEIPEGVLTVENMTFSTCSRLVQVKLPSTIKSIGNWSFFGCTGLTGINLPNGLVSIGDEAFSGCASLSKITIPETVTSISEKAFWNCNRLTIYAKPGSFAFDFRYRSSMLSKIPVMPLL